MSAEDIVTSQQNFALATVAEADTFLAKLANLAEASFFFVPNAQQIPSPGYAFDTSAATQALLRSLFPAAISVADITATAPTFTPATIDALPDVTVPDFNKSAPVLEMAATPDRTMPIKPTAPSITVPVIPPVPTLPAVSPLTLTGITFHPVEGITIPDLPTSQSVGDLVVPTNNFSFFEQLYTSALLDELQAKLLDNLQNGGYGIEPLDEAALFDRARSRELVLSMQQTDALIAGAEARGFPRPPGDMFVALQRGEQDLQNKMSTINRDIALKRADMYVENRKFIFEQTKALEQILIGYHNSVMERSLNAAKAALDVALKIYDAQVARFNAKNEADKTAAAVLESRIRSVALQLERSRIQMEGTRIENDVQRTYVEVFNAQWHGVEQIINLWKGQLEGAQIAAGIEKLRLEAFHELMAGFTAEVQAKVAEFNMVEAQNKGQLARAEAFATEAKAYSEIVNASKVKSDILLGKLKGQIEIANQGIEVFKAQGDLYKTDIYAQAQTIDAKVRVYGSQVQGASAEAGAVGEGIRLDVTERDLEMRRNIANANIAMDGARLMLDGLVKSAESRVQAGDAAGKYYTAIVASAVNSINTLSAIVAQQ